MIIATISIPQMVKPYSQSPSKNRNTPPLQETSVMIILPQQVTIAPKVTMSIKSRILRMIWRICFIFLSSIYYKHHKNRIDLREYKKKDDCYPNGRFCHLLSFWGEGIIFPKEKPYTKSNEQDNFSKPNNPHKVRSKVGLTPESEHIVEWFYNVSKWLRSRYKNISSTGNSCSDNYNDNHSEYLPKYFHNKKLYYKVLFFCNIITEYMIQNMAITW